jgi:hypothetical protein
MKADMAVETHFDLSRRSQYIIMRSFEKPKERCNKEKGEAFTRGLCPLTYVDHTILLEVAFRQRCSPELGKFQKRISKRIACVVRCDRLGDFVP